MPNIGALLKQEIVRLSRREVKTQVEATRKSSALYRHHIAALKRQVATLESQVALLERKVLARPRPVDGDATAKFRFVAKGLKSQRNRLGLSAAEYGKLVGVSAQSIYNWEQGHATPRPEQLGTIASLRRLRKREAQRRVEELSAKDAPKAAKG
jgi:DNA-binding XRE family transcriptional regulator